MGQGTTRRPILRRWMFNLVMLSGVWLIIEGGAFVAMILFVGSPSQLADQRRNAATQEPFQPGGSFTAPAVLHPYLGCVMEPQDDGGKLTIDGKFRVTEYGFTDTQPPFHKRAADKVIVGIVGGSVARQLSLNGTEQLERELSQSPEFAGKSFEFVRLANNGYKQPQQLMTVNYLLTLGAEFDILINLDGVNEAALPAMDNIPFGVFSAYPRDWGKLIAGAVNPEFQRRSGYVVYLRQQHRDVARWYGHAPWCYLPTAQLWCAGRLNRTMRLINSELELMARVNESRQTYSASGPPEHFEGEAAVYEHCTEIWLRSSILLQQVCAARGIRYFHFLQPNQYVPGSKPINPKEAAIAIDEKNPIGHSVRHCFPLMQAKAPELAAANVAFTDLTRVFEDHPEPLYKDTCCHVERAGDLILATAIAARITDSNSTREKTAP